MIRVIYRWKLAPEHLTEFIEVWRRATREIHKTTPGALGSFCLESISEPREVMTVALWQTEADWRRFIGTARTGPMAPIHGIAELISATPYHQHGDETVTG